MGMDGQPRGAPARRSSRCHHDGRATLSATGRRSAEPVADSCRLVVRVRGQAGWWVSGRGPARRRRPCRRRVVVLGGAREESTRALVSWHLQADGSIAPLAPRGAHKRLGRTRLAPAHAAASALQANPVRSARGPVRSLVRRSRRRGTRHAGGTHASTVGRLGPGSLTFLQPPRSVAVLGQQAASAALEDGERPRAGGPTQGRSRLRYPVPTEETASQPATVTASIADSAGKS
jgi:hypothetical protein